jgi:hypothetical protein
MAEFIIAKKLTKSQMTEHYRKIVEFTVTKMIDFTVVK